MKTIVQIFESLRMAVQSVVVNKVRTLLSLFGITIGIFAIISVFTALDTMEDNLRQSVNKVGTNIAYVGRWPWMPEEGHEFEWWKYYSRPVVRTGELAEVKELVHSAQDLALAVYINDVTIARDNRSQKAEAVAATYRYDQMRQSDVQYGRYFTSFESESSARVALLGATLADNLFDNAELAVGQTIKVNNTRLTVIGVFEREGSNMFGLSFDEQILIPYSLAGNFVNLAWTDKDLIVKGKDGVSLGELSAEITSAMRRIRRLSPSTPDNFAVNELTGMMNHLNQVFSMINIVGGIIGVFSILVGGFGVANIMFVSVRERTSQIGIQKALGAKSYTILLQFTFESVLLSLMGGGIGLLLIWAGAAAVSAMSDFVVVLSLKNIMIGLSISSVVGAIAGIFPAYSAAKLDPVVAITKS